MPARIVAIAAAGGVGAETSKRNCRVSADQALVEAAQAGDSDAVSALVRRYQARIFNFSMALTANAADAEDLAQETIIRAFRGLHRFRGDSSFKNWLYRIATNAAHTRRGKQLRRAAVWEARVESDEVTERHLASTAESVEQRAIRRQAIDRALAALPPDQRAAVVLHDVEGLEYREIGDVLEIPIGTVMSRIFRARRRLRPLLAGLGDNRAPDEATGSASNAASPVAQTARAQVKT